MKSKIVSVFMILFAVMLAKGEYLLWMVQQDSSASDAVEFQYAKVKVLGNVDDGTYLTMSGDTTDVLWSGYPTSEMGYTTDQIYANLGAYSGDTFSFVVELYNNVDELVGTGSVQTYASLHDYIYGNMSQTGIDPYIARAFQSVPEPTSGMLVLVGTALLALRRRKIS